MPRVFKSRRAGAHGISIHHVIKLRARVVRRVPGGSSEDSGARVVACRGAGRRGPGGREARTTVAITVTSTSSIPWEEKAGERGPWAAQSEEKQEGALVLYQFDEELQLLQQQQQLVVQHHHHLHQLQQHQQQQHQQQQGELFL